MGQSFSNAFMGIPELLRSLLIIDERSSMVVKNMAYGVISLDSNPALILFYLFRDLAWDTNFVPWFPYL